jgi:hypothetical protein
LPLEVWEIRTEGLREFVAAGVGRDLGFRSSAVTVCKQRIAEVPVWRFGAYRLLEKVGSAI